MCIIPRWLSESIVSVLMCCLGMPGGGFLLWLSCHPARLPCLQSTLTRPGNRSLGSCDQNESVFRQSSSSPVLSRDHSPWPEENSSRQWAKNLRNGGQCQKKHELGTLLCTLWSHKSFLLESSKPWTDISLVLPRSCEAHRWQV